MQLFYTLAAFPLYVAKIQHQVQCATIPHLIFRTKRTRLRSINTERSIVMAEPAASVALITGAGRGIGRAAAHELAQRGVQVALMARTSEEIAATAEEIRAAGGTALDVACDVSDVTALSRAVALIKQRLGPPTILVNNAALIGPLQATAEVEPAAWARTLEVNLIGAFYAARLALPDMLAAGWGRIINVSSGAAQGSGIERGSAYSVSKAGMDMLTRALAAELTDTSIAVVTVYPGVVDTAMQTAIRSTPAQQLGAATSARFHGYYEQGQLISPALPGRLIAVLCGAAGQAYHGAIVRISDEAAQRLLQATA